VWGVGLHDIHYKPVWKVGAASHQMPTLAPRVRMCYTQSHSRQPSASCGARVGPQPKGPNMANPATGRRSVHGGGVLGGVRQRALEDPMLFREGLPSSGTSRIRFGRSVCPLPALPRRRTLPHGAVRLIGALLKRGRTGGNGFRQSVGPNCGNCFRSSVCPNSRNCFGSSWPPALVLRGPQHVTPEEVLALGVREVAATELVADGLDGRTRWTTAFWCRRPVGCRPPPNSVRPHVSARAEHGAGRGESTRCSGLPPRQQRQQAPRGFATSSWPWVVTPAPRRCPAQRA
jgi:hypothetical protein